jgi:DNA-directed RNA polymerase specialized sigma subunit
MEVSVLRELIRNLQSWESLYAAREVEDTLPGPGGVEYNLFDVQYIYSCRTRLAPRQRQAIELFLYENVREKRVAEMMGVSTSNPVAMYATDGLKRLCFMIDSGMLERYDDRVEQDA